MNTLSVLDYNIWFDTYNMAERTMSLIDVIEDKKPDVILLQEVRPKIAEILDMALSKLGYVSHFPDAINESYNCMIFSKYKMRNIAWHPYTNSNMGRGLVTALINFPIISKINNDINISSIDILLATTHFESIFDKKHSDVKIDQYQYVKNELDAESIKYIIFGSDTNIANENEDKLFFKDKYWNDAYDDCAYDNKDDNNYTYDTETNKNLIMRKIKNLRSRIDRILYKGDMNIQHFELIKEGNFIIPPSDHHGIFVKFEIIV